MNLPQNEEILVEKKVKLYGCHYCRKKGLTQSGRWRHEFSRHQEKFSSNKAAKTEKKLVKCAQCEASFTRPQGLKRHMSKQHQISAKLQVNEEEKVGD